MYSFQLFLSTYRLQHWSMWSCACELRMNSPFSGSIAHYSISLYSFTRFFSRESSSPTFVWVPPCFFTKFVFNSIACIFKLLICLNILQILLRYVQQAFLSFCISINYRTIKLDKNYQLIYYLNNCLYILVYFIYDFSFISNLDIRKYLNFPLLFICFLIKNQNK